MRLLGGDYLILIGVGFGRPPLAFPVTVENGVTLTQNAVGDYTISGTAVTNSVNFRMTTTGIQVSEVYLVVFLELGKLIL